MKKVLKSVGLCCAVLLLVINLGCGERAQNWAISQGYGFANLLSRAAFDTIILALFPNLGTTTTTVTTTTPNPQ